MSLDSRVQGQREDMIEDIHHHMEQVDVHDDLLNLAQTIVSSGFYMTNAEGYGFDHDDFECDIYVDSDYPFALVKYLNQNFNEKFDFNTKDALINIKKPDWIT